MLGLEQVGGNRNGERWAWSQLPTQMLPTFPFARDFNFLPLPVLRLPTFCSPSPQTTHSPANKLNSTGSKVFELALPFSRQFRVSSLVPSYFRPTSSQPLPKNAIASLTLRSVEGRQLRREVRRQQQGQHSEVGKQTDLVDQQGHRERPCKPHQLPPLYQQGH